jgi:hypothetical protein
MFRYKCHNCSAGLLFETFLKKLDPALHREYLMEAFTDSGPAKRSAFSDTEISQAIEESNKIARKLAATEADSFPVVKKRKELDQLFTMAELPKSHMAWEYVKSRKLEPFSDMFYFSENYMDWVHSYVNPEKFERSPATDPRLVMTYKDEIGQIYAYTGRSFGKDKKTKYMHTKIPEYDDRPLLWGLDRVDFTKPVFAIEGQINSLFLPNAIAASGASMNVLFNHPYVRNITFVWDNDSRNLEIVKLVEKAINVGVKVVIYPKNCPEGDINDYIISGMSSEEIANMLHSNTFSGPTAKLMFGQWKKVTSII